MAGSGEKDTLPTNNQGGYQQNDKKQRNKKIFWWSLIGFTVLVVVVLVAVLGGVLGYRHTHKHHKTNNESTQVGPNDTDPKIKANVSVKALNTFTWGSDKAIGVSIGNWLVLERWMNEDWMIEKTNNNSVDEWTFTEALGDKASDVMNEHWASWITEDDVQTLFENGFNHVRVPTGYWMWIGTQSGEPYVTTGQTKYLERMLAWCYVREMHVVIDLHGMPGSQNGEQTSGHLTSSPTFFTPENQQRARQTIQTVIDWVAVNPYRSVVSAIEVINEPRPYGDGEFDQMRSFYDDAYHIINNSSYPVPIFMHHAYAPGNRLSYWRDFVTQKATSPPSLIYEDHPYPGNFPPVTNGSAIIGATCYWGRQYVDYPVPIVISEWSLFTGVKDKEFEHQFFDTQLATWSWSAGGFYWSFKLNPSKGQLAQGIDYSQYSLMTLISNSTNVVPKPTEFGLLSTVKNDDAVSFINAANNSCGARPSNAAPFFNNSSPPPTWTAGVSVLSTATKSVLKATGTSAASTTSLASISGVPKGSSTPESATATSSGARRLK